MKKLPLPPHLFAAVAPARRARYFWPLLAATLLLLTVFGLTGAALTTEAAPYGVVSFELAGSVENMRQILASWDAETQLRAAFGLGLDFLFLPVYAAMLAFGCLMSAGALGSNRWPLAGLGGPLAWGALLAALLDVVENIALTTILFGGPASPWPEIARWCALPKFGLIFLALVYLIFGGTAALASRTIARGH